MSDPASLDSFIDKWRDRWPEWGIVSVFVPAGERARVAAWLSLLQELRDAAWGGTDPAPGLAKLAWWQEELRGWNRGARRHPLGDALHKLDAPWSGLGGALLALASTRAPAGDADETAGMVPFATAMLACEAALFDGRSPGDADVACAAAALCGERAMVQGDRGAAARWRGAIAATHGPSRVRRLQQAILRERLEALAEGRGSRRIPVFGLLFAGWRAARAG